MSIYLGLGSNSGNRRRYLSMAIQDLRTRGIRPIQTSSIYETEPVGTPGQRNFLNMVCRVETVDGPLSLLDCCQKIELKLGRKHQEIARTIDIDLLFFRGLLFSGHRLNVPHPRLYNRRFVLLPMAEIAPNFLDPQSGSPISDLLEKCQDSSSVRPIRHFMPTYPRKPLL
jgi:2-amino-4-hydroxy-6-hydroxymethyldihydropteridine diphosphokinase